jgi:hypothetical protein
MSSKSHVQGSKGIQCQISCTKPWKGGIIIVATKPHRIKPQRGDTRLAARGCLNQNLQDFRIARMNAASRGGTSAPTGEGNSSGSTPNSQFLIPNS